MASAGLLSALTVLGRPIFFYDRQKTGKENNLFPIFSKIRPNPAHFLGLKKRLTVASWLEYL